MLSKAGQTGRKAESPGEPPCAFDATIPKPAIVIAGIVFDNGNSASPRELNCTHASRASLEDLLVRKLFRTIARADDLVSLTVVSPGGVT